MDLISVEHVFLKKCWNTIEYHSVIKTHEYVYFKRMLDNLSKEADGGGGHRTVNKTEGVNLFTKELDLGQYIVHCLIP